MTYRKSNKLCTPGHGQSMKSCPTLPRRKSLNIFPVTSGSFSRIGATKFWNTFSEVDFTFASSLCLTLSLLGEKNIDARKSSYIDSVMHSNA